MTDALTTRVRLQYYTGRKLDSPWDNEAVAWFAAHSELKPALDAQHALVIVSAGGREVRIGDQALSLIPELCFNAVAAVLQTGVADFRLYSATTDIRLTAVEGEQIELRSNVFATEAFAKWPVLEGLVACGDRFLHMAPLIWAGDSDLDMLDYIHECAGAARAALDAARKNP